MLVDEDRQPAVFLQHISTCRDLMDNQLPHPRNVQASADAIKIMPLAPDIYDDTAVEPVGDSTVSSTSEALL